MGENVCTFWLQYLCDSKESLQCVTDIFENIWQRQSSKSKALVRGKQWWRDSAEVNSSMQGWNFAGNHQLLDNEVSVLS